MPVGSSYDVANLIELLANFGFRPAQKPSYLQETFAAQDAALKIADIGS